MTGLERKPPPLGHDSFFNSGPVLPDFASDANTATLWRNGTHTEGQQQQQFARV
jgi:hypothetical protein